MAKDAIPTYPASYDPSGTTNNPPGSDTRREGDDQIRILKANMQQTTPNWSGPVNATQDEVNTLLGINTGATVESRLATLEAESAKFPSGTVISFHQAAAPTGWTQVTTAAYDNAMLRVVNTAGGGSGGSDSPILNNKVSSHTHPFTAVSDGQHDHAIYQDGGGQSRTMVQSVASGPGNDGSTPIRGQSGTIFIMTLDGTHDHAGSTTDANTGASDWTPKYIDMIIASKD